MRVFMVEASAKGGLIHYAYQLCRGLQRNGVTTTLVTSTHYELHDHPHEFHVNEFLNLWDPRGPKASNPVWGKVRRALRGVQYVVEWWRLVRMLQRERPDVVLFGEMRFPFEAYFLRMLRQSGLVLADIVHDVQPYNTSRRSDQVVASGAELAGFNRIYREFDALFVHDRSNYDRFLELYDVDPALVHQIFLPSDELMLEIRATQTPAQLRERFGVAEGQPVLLFFGTITKYKGLEDLLRALPEIVAQVPDVRLIVAGFPAKDVDSGALQALVTDAGLDAHVAWYLDYVPNGWVATLLGISDAVVLPYRAITQSAVLQNAYACGKPVVVTRVGGLPDVVEAGRSGYLAEPENPASLAEAVIQLLKDRDTAATMGHYNRQLAEQEYSWRSMAGRIKVVFDGAAAGDR